MTPTKEQTIAIAATASVVAGVVALGVYNKEKTKQLATASYTSIAASASAAATKTSESFKAVQAATTSSANSVVNSASATWDSLARRLGLKRVKSFPIVPDEEDVVAAKDQSSKSKKSKKNAAALEKTGVAVQATA